MDITEQLNSIILKNYLIRGSYTALDSLINLRSYISSKVGGLTIFYVHKGTIQKAYVSNSYRSTDDEFLFYYMNFSLASNSSISMRFKTSSYNKDWTIITGDKVREYRD